MLLYFSENCHQLSTSSYPSALKPYISMQMRLTKMSDILGGFKLTLVFKKFCKKALIISMRFATWRSESANSLLDPVISSHYFLHLLILIHVRIELCVFLGHTVFFPPLSLYTFLTVNRPKYGSKTFLALLTDDPFLAELGKSLPLP